MVTDIEAVTILYMYRICVLFLSYNAIEWRTLVEEILELAENLLF